jgi:hypothetical protein
MEVRAFCPLLVASRGNREECEASEVAKPIDLTWTGWTGKQSTNERVHLGRFRDEGLKKQRRMLDKVEHTKLAIVEETGSC